MRRALLICVVVGICGCASRKGPPRPVEALPVIAIEADPRPALSVTLPPRAALTRAPDHVRVMFSVDNGPVDLRLSTNLNTWLPALTLHRETAGVLTLLDYDLTPPQKFYRVTPGP